jgi:hypothetical protein
MGFVKPAIKFGAGALALLACVLPAHAGDTTGKRSSIAWAPSFSDAVQEATERNLPIFLHSHAATCPPCHAIRKAVFESRDYVAWANASTVHLISYYVAPEDQEAEPTQEVERDGAKVSALVSYPDFTPLEMELLIRGIDQRLQFPEKTPWAGVISPDGRTVLAAKPGKASAKDFREAYEAEAKKLGPSISRDAWLEACAWLRASTEAEVDERWADAVAPARKALAASVAYPKALRARVVGQVEALHAARQARLEAAARLPAAERAKETARLEAAFAGLPAVPAEGTAETAAPDAPAKDAPAR